jgi:succinoglycan biosynthesis protein ExoM
MLLLRSVQECYTTRGEKVRVAVCVITYLRAEGLKRLLRGLDELTSGEGAAPDLKIIVIDNDPDGSACVLCENLRPSLRWALQCWVEPRRGIPYARNTAVACAGEDVDFIAFIDDDEVPEPSWLAELLRIQQVYDADVVQGPVIPRFSGSVPTWVTKDGFFHRTRYPTGYRLVEAATNNVLVRSRVFREMDNHFDERLALTGGSDGHFFRRVHRAGYKMVWADEAVVYEWVPQSRINVKWVLRREYRLGSMLSFRDLDTEPSAKVLAKRVAKGGGWIVRGLSLVPLSAVLGQHKLVRALRYISRGAGQLAGTVGMRYEEYRKVHGA